MTVWRQVQETLYERWRVAWAATTPYQLGNEAGFDPPAAPWCKLMIMGRPSGSGTLGPRGRIDRRGAIFIMLREPPGHGVGSLADLAGLARAVFEFARIDENDIRFSTGDIGDESEVDSGRWWGVTVELVFDYEDVK